VGGRIGEGRHGGADGNPLQMPLWSPQESTPGWHVRISRRARRLSMRVFPGGRVEVVVPPGVGLPAIERFVARHRAWAERRVRDYALLAPACGERRPASLDLPLTGQRWAVEYEPARRAAVHQRADGVLQVRLASATDRAVGQLLLRWLAGIATDELRQRLEETSRETGIDYVRMHLRRQRTRWGSCSVAGTISLNVCLMFQRPGVVRYLLVHELCHRLQMNHSPRFWSLVESHEPGWRALDAELLKGWRNVPAWVFPG
jgi:predicted metal-dependent hydrolase